ncbi:DUF948 domain-containing protein [Calothrix sp. PCC 6303]|uniref:DUF948 domain-containing protein n=1 Tax=Calothrix sp. PCC 6303 TaxID=1170562 RepID=UPI0002A04A9C|nr:DUF948 domain-containing protein [Calothrix sp. PCC 6303]AFZ02362.1 hypothetical protein Cal6303_3427 [Calothrix sp. PCC 6303]
MTEPLFWLGFSILLVATSLTAVLVVSIPALQELARAARSAEKLFDTLSRELPPTLDAIRMTSLEITDLTGDVSDGVQSVTQTVQQVDQSLESARKQAQNLQIGTRSLFVGVKTAWKTFTRQKPSKRPINHTTKQPLTLREWELRPENRRSSDNGYRNGDWVNDYENKFDTPEIPTKSSNQNADDWSGEE